MSGLKRGMRNTHASPQHLPVISKRSTFSKTTLHDNGARRRREIQNKNKPSNAVDDKAGYFPRRFVLTRLWYGLPTRFQQETCLKSIETGRDGRLGNPVVGVAIVVAGVCAALPHV